MEQRNEQATIEVELHAYFHLPAKRIALVEGRPEAGETRLGLAVVEERSAA